MISNGSVSLNNIVTDLDLTTANANLNDPRIRARARKFSGANSINDLRGSVAAMMPNMADNFNYGQYRYLNYKDVYNPNGNLAAFSVEMSTNGDASKGVDLSVTRDYFNGGDVSAQVVFCGYCPVNNYGGVKVEGTIVPSAATPNSYMKFELIGWDRGYFQGTAFRGYSLEPIITTTNLAEYAPYMEVRASHPYITGIVYVITKSNSVTATTTGKVNNFYMGL